MDHVETENVFSAKILRVSDFMAKGNPNYCKKKQPDIVRSNLLEAAARILAEEGLAGFTLDAVANKAGVSKGGLVHHFASKQALLEVLAQEMFGRFEKSIDAFVSSDPEPQGRFVRAYIRAAFSPFEPKANAKLLGGLSTALCHNESLIAFYRTWFQKLLQKYQIDALSTREQMLRFASDGIWEEETLGLVTMTATDRDLLIDYLVQQTYGDSIQRPATQNTKEN